jgi:hypothetical protein
VLAVDLLLTTAQTVGGESFLETPEYIPVHASPPRESC